MRHTHRHYFILGFWTTFTFEWQTWKKEEIWVINIPTIITASQDNTYILPLLHVLYFYPKTLSCVMPFYELLQTAPKMQKSYKDLMHMKEWPILFRLFMYFCILAVFLSLNKFSCFWYYMPQTFNHSTEKQDRDTNAHIIPQREVFSKITASLFIDTLYSKLSANEQKNWHLTY